MIKNFEVKNYRGLKHLKLDNLARVNLFAGKNNVGKTAVLEALSILYTGGKEQTIAELLTFRGEKLPVFREQPNVLDSNLFAMRALFYTREISGYDNVIQLKSTNKSVNESIELSIVKYDDVTNEESAFENGDAVIEAINTANTRRDLNKIRLKINSPGLIRFIPLGESFMRKLSSVEMTLSSRYLYIPSSSLIDSTTARLFDRIIGTTFEDQVIDALKLIEPKIIRLYYIELNRERVPIVKLEDSQTLYPLSSMGDGANRILRLIVSLVNVSNGCLIIDEFENGLHYTVQQKLWEIIFKLSKELNVQVFATTHSYDCIRAFSEVANRTEEEDGKLIRLENINGDIKAVAYDEELMEIATEKGIEVR